MADFSKIKPIKALILDVDGVLTDGCVQLREDGEWVRRFNVRDGVGIKILQEKGFEVCVITGAKSGDVITRVGFLGIKHFYRGVVDKTESFKNFLSTVNLEASECAYIGDDIFDVPLLDAVGFSASVNNAIDEAIDSADYITKRPGGGGAVRELIDLLLKHSDLARGGVDA